MKLANTLGFGVNMLVAFLENLSDSVIEELDAVPSPPLELCRICERSVPTWWFEGHSELCLIEHKSSSDLEAIHENLLDQRKTVVRLLSIMENAPALIAEKPPPIQPSSSFTSENSIATGSSHSNSSTPKLEYRGLALPWPIQSPATPIASPARSPGLPSHFSTLKRPLTKNHKKSPVKSLELLIELCDLALDVHAPEVSSDHTSTEVLHSPINTSKINQVMSWAMPQMEEPAMVLLSEDTLKYAKQKVDAVIRMGDIFTYSETVKRECEAMVLDVIEDTISKAALQKDDPDVFKTEEYDNESDEAETDIDESGSCFSESYLRSDALPSSRLKPSQGFTKQYVTADYLGPRDSVPSTPKSLLSGSQLSPFPVEVTTSVALTKPKKAATCPEQLDLHPTDLDLNAAPSSSKRSMSTISSLSSSSHHSSSFPWTSLQRNNAPHSPDFPPPTTPLASPLIYAHDSFPFESGLRRPYSFASDLSRGPTSPLLTSIVTPVKPGPPSITDYEIINAISKGAFGSVYLARKKLTGEYFAIKVLKKADMIAKNQVMNVRAERAIMMSQSDSPFVANLYFTFQSKHYLYLVMEYLNGGDCAALIKGLGGLPEEWAKRYIAELISGVGDLHRKGIIHRDLKPDNLLINQSGHLKLTDFGLSRMGIVGRQTRHNSIAYDESLSKDSSGSLLQTRQIKKCPTNPEGTKFSASVLASPGNPSSSVDSISLVPDYFNLNMTQDRAAPHSGTGSVSSMTGEALFNNTLMIRSAKLADYDEENNSSNSSDIGGSGSASMKQGSAGSTIDVRQNGFLNPNSTSNALLDFTDKSQKFVGTPDYLAPETIQGVEQNEESDWWSVGCILFEFLYGYPPFHAASPDLVFENILNREIQWPDPIEQTEEMCADNPPPSDTARDLIERLLNSDQSERLGANGGLEEIKSHPFFDGINWETLWQDEASFIPLSDNPESTDYFDPRGADTLEFPTDSIPMEEDEDEQKSGESSEEGSTSGRSGGSAESQFAAQVQSRRETRSKLPLHIPPHVRKDRSRRLSEPVATDDFGNFAFKNLPMLDKANKTTLSRIVTENIERRNSMTAETLKRPRGLSISTNTGFRRPESPLSTHQTSPVRRLSCSSGSPQSGNSMSAILSGSPANIPAASTSQRPNAPAKQRRGSAMTFSLSLLDSPAESASPLSPFHSPSTATSITELGSPTKSGAIAGNVKFHSPMSPHGLGFRRLSNAESSPDLREQFRKQTNAQRYAQVFDSSPSNSDTEDVRGSALRRLQKRRENSQKRSNLSLLTPTYRPLLILICEGNPALRCSMEQLIKSLNCRFVTVRDPADTIRYATGKVKFDLIFTEFKFTKTSGADVARIIHTTSNYNTETPIVCVTSYAPEATNVTGSTFSSIIRKPLTVEKLTAALELYCCWKPKEPKLKHVSSADNDPAHES